MKTPTNRRIILCLDPYLLTTALAAWLERDPGLEVVIDRSGVSVPSAEPSDVVVSTRAFVSKATVIVVDPNGTNVSVHRAGRVERHPYQGLDRLAALINRQRASPTGGVRIETGGCG